MIHLNNIHHVRCSAYVLYFDLLYNLAEIITSEGLEKIMNE